VFAGIASDRSGVETTDWASMSTFTESIVEQANFAWLESLGRFVQRDLEIASGALSIERFISDPYV